MICKNCGVGRDESHKYCDQCARHKFIVEEGTVVEKGNPRWGRGGFFSRERNSRWWKCGASGDGLPRQRILLGKSQITNLQQNRRNQKQIQFFKRHKSPHPPLQRQPNHLRISRGLGITVTPIRFISYPCHPERSRGA